MQRLLILSSDTGEGHNSAAEAVRSLATRQGFRVSIRKPIEESSRINRQLGQLYNYLLTHHPNWMGAFAHSVDIFRPNEADICYRRVSSYIERFLETEQPNIVLSVHPMLNHMIQRWITERNLNIPCYTFVTDPFPPFWKGWISPYVNRYFVVTHEAAQAVEAGGVSADQIECVAMPLRPEFTPMPRHDIQETRKDLGVDGDLILINGGARGGGPLRQMAEEVHRAATSAHVVVVCGHNDRVRRQLESERNPQLIVRGFVNDIHRLVGASDLVVTKPGALSTYEALASAVPTVLSAIGGLMPQESGLFEAARQKGFGFAVGTLGELRNVIARGVEGWASRQGAIADFYQPETSRELVERIQSAYAKT